MELGLLVTSKDYVIPNFSRRQFGNYTIHMGSDVIYHQDQEQFLALTGTVNQVNGYLHSLSGDSVELLFQLDRLSNKDEIHNVEGTFMFISISMSDLFVCNDYMGTMPVYYTDTPGAICVTNQAKMLIPLPDINLQLKPVETVQKIQPPEFCIFEAIKKLRPGNSLLNGNSCETSRTISKPSSQSTEVLSEQLDKLFHQSVSRSVANETAVSALLSGGVDSSFVCAKVSEIIPNIQTISMGTERSNEFKWANIVANHVNSDHLEINLTSEDIVKGIVEAVFENEIFDGKAAEIHAPMSKLYRSAKHSRVLTGYGADLLFGGILDSDCDLSKVEPILLRETDRTKWTHEMSPFLARKYGVTIQHPYWSPEIVRFAQQLPAHFKVGNGTTKVLLRNVAKTYLPEVTAFRKKIGIHEASMIDTILGDLLACPKNGDYRFKNIFVYNIFRQLFQDRQPLSAIDINGIVSPVGKTPSPQFIIKQLENHILILHLNHPNPLNPFNLELETAIISALKEADQDPEVKSVVLYGGVGRSFSAGGDFREVKQYKGGPEVDRWIDRIVNLYVAPLNFSKPIVAAVDGYAIGMGFQFALTFDWRIGSEQCKFDMPELKNGISCIFGACMLGHTLDHFRMQEILYECKPMDSQTVKRLGILNQVVPREELLAEAVKKAMEFASYPETPFRNTKAYVNSEFTKKLRDVAEYSKRAHKESFSAGSSTKHLQKILRDKF